MRMLPVCNSCRFRSRSHGCMCFEAVFLLMMYMRYSRILGSRNFCRRCCQNRNCFLRVRFRRIPAFFRLFDHSCRTSKGLRLHILMMLVLCICGWMIAEGADNTFGYLCAGGLTASITGGVLIHVGVVTRLLPTTGMPLPLVSWGGTNLIITMVSLGIIARVAEGGERCRAS